MAKDILYPIILVPTDVDVAGVKTVILTDNCRLINSKEALFLIESLKDLIEFNRVNAFNDIEICKTNTASFNSKKGCVYLMYSKDRGLFKIGKTRHLKNRVRSIVNQEKGSCDLVFVHENVDNYSKKELMFHKMFASKRIVGEWFILDKEDVEKFKKGIDGNK